MKERENLNQKDFYTINRFSTSSSNLSSNIISIINEEKTYEELCKNVQIQNKIINEYHSWVNTLSNIISEQDMTSNHLDLGTPVQERLEFIQNLTNKNLEIKTKIFEQIEKNKKLEDKIQIKKWNLNNCVKDFNNKTQKSIKETNQILENNVQQMANELDNLLELKMEIDIVTGNNEGYKTIDDYISNNTMKHHKTLSKDSNFSSKIFQNIDNNMNNIGKIKELYYTKKRLSEENELLMKILNFFTPDSIKENNKILCGCRGDIKKNKKNRDNK